MAQKQDQRAIQSKEINNGSYLITWVTSCSSRQPLPNLWTSLVRAEPKQSPCAPCTTSTLDYISLNKEARADPVDDLALCCEWDSARAEYNK